VLDAADRAEFLAVLPFFSNRSLDDLFEYTTDRLLDGIRTQSTGHTTKAVQQ